MDDNYRNKFDKSVAYPIGHTWKKFSSWGYRKKFSDSVMG